jgi:hypothetical protein
LKNILTLEKILAIITSLKDKNKTLKKKSKKTSEKTKSKKYFYYNNFSIKNNNIDYSSSKDDSKVYTQKPLIYKSKNHAELKY